MPFASDVRGDGSFNHLPRLPVLGWSAFRGKRVSPVPAIVNAPYCRYTISGRAAIAAALQVLGITRGDRVLVPTYHCPTMIAPVSQSYAEPLFYPITAAGSPNLQWLREAPLDGVKALLAVHYFGLIKSMSELRDFCVSRGIALIEDCCHAFFGATQDCPVGTWGDVSVASLTKFFPVSEGGVIASYTRRLDDVQLCARGLYGQVKAVVDGIEIGVEHGRFTGLNTVLSAVFRTKKWIRGNQRAPARPCQPVIASDAPVEPPLLSSARPAWAVRWIVKHVHHDRIILLRRRNYMQLARRLSDVQGARVMQADLLDAEAPYVFPLYVEQPSPTYKRVRAAGIPVFRWDEVWPGTPNLPGDHGLDWSTHVFQLGCHQDLSTDDIDHIADGVRGIIDNSTRC